MICWPRRPDRLAGAALGPTGFAESPYQSPSSFAGNTNLISLDDLVEAGWLRASDRPTGPISRAARQTTTRRSGTTTRCSLAYDRFVTCPDDRAACDAWCADPERWWLDDFALFAALKEFHGGRPWVDWEESEVFREKQALGAARVMHSCRIDEHRFRQWVFYTQWDRLRAYANGKGIRIVGDIPIYVAHDSSDVWVSPELFELDFNGRPHFIAGVPPDYFSSTDSAGQPAVPVGRAPHHRLPLVDQAPGGGAQAGGHRAHRSLPRLRPLL